MLLALPAPLASYADKGAHPIVQGATPGTASIRSCKAGSVLQTWNSQPGLRIQFEVQCPDCEGYLNVS